MEVGSGCCEMSLPLFQLSLMGLELCFCHFIMKELKKALQPFQYKSVLSVENESAGGNNREGAV